MLVIRPIATSDYSALYHCAIESGHGFTSLPVNEELLNRRINHSLSSFNKNDVKGPSDEGYLMVAFDDETGDVVGTTGIEAAVGWERPFYSYHIDTHVHRSTKLSVNKEVKLLTLGNNYTGCSELCTLFLLPKYRQGLNGRLLSKSRFMMLAQHPQRFSRTIIAEMRGVSNQEGNSPFWQWLQEHFFSIDFTLADYLTGIGHKGFIADLMPKAPIYINLLSSEAQAVVAQVHENTKPALKLLEREGFCCRGYVDIFDAGPTVECDINNIESVRHSEVANISVCDQLDSASPQLQTMLISNTLFQDFRATMASAVYDQSRNTIFLSARVAKALLVSGGDPVRFIIQDPIIGGDK
ncbi:arginine N-succinyltransferase [Vibrio sp. RC27]